MLTVENVINPAAFNISGNVHLHEGPSQGGLPSKTPPVNIIQTDQDLYVHFVWKQSGFLCPLLNGKWKCSVYMEFVGNGPNPNIKPQMVKYAAICPKTNSAVTKISAGTLKEGVYKVIATLQFEGSTGKPTPIAAYDEIGVLQVYND